MKKLLLYSAIVLALGACKNGSTTKTDDKGTTGTTTTSGDKGTTTGTSTTSTPMETSSGSGSWSSTDKDTFMQTCTNAAAKSMGESKAKDYCSCMLDKIEVKFPNSADAGKMTANETTDMAKECLNMK